MSNNDAYLKAFADALQDEILAAYAEGRVK